MPHADVDELPSAGGGRWPLAGDRFRSAQWGDMEVGHTTTEPLDCAGLYRIGGLPGGVCTCPHYGYVFEGSIRATYPNTDWADEVATAGQVYFFRAGHVLIYPEPTKALEFNPAFALQQCMDAMQTAGQRAGLETGIADSVPPEGNSTVATQDAAVGVSDPTLRSGSDVSRFR